MLKISPFFIFWYLLPQCKQLSHATGIISYLPHSSFIFLPPHLDINIKREFSSVQSLSHVQLFESPWIAARQAYLSIANSRSSLRLTSIESVMPSSHLILCRPLLLLPPIPPRIRVFSNEPALRMRWPKYWSFSFSIIPSKEQQFIILSTDTFEIPTA